MISEVFRGTETWIFDLDNTLYSPRCNLFAEIDSRMTAFICRALALEPADARALQKDYYVSHGTTLRGLMDVHGLEPAAFLDYVHEIDLSGLVPDGALAAALFRLPGRRIVYTNGSARHARRVLEALDLATAFDEIVDIERAGYEPKPARAPLERLVAELGLRPASAAMFEDIARNLETPHALGMRTVLVRSPEHPDRDHIYEHVEEDGRPAHVDHVTDDLAAFLAALVPASG